MNKYSLGSIRMKQIIFILLFISGTLIGQAVPVIDVDDLFTFDVAADMRQYAEPEFRSSEYFQGVCEAIKEVGKGEFMISPGDIDPPYHVKKTIQDSVR